MFMHPRAGIQMVKVIASHNGLKAVKCAWSQLQAGMGPLDACVAGVTLVEDDPDELTVGFGGLPNEDGVVELDAAVMDGTTRRGAGVAALQNIRHPTQVAQRLMEQTSRALLVGAGAYAFARANGFPHEELLTDRARRMWHYWKRTRSDYDDWRAPPRDEDLEVQHWFDHHFYRRPDSTATGTVHCAARNGAGQSACATSTSGHAFKLAGRVGDSPVLGAGLYADDQWGTCGSIGHGEANLHHLSSFAVLERLREGDAVNDAAMAVLERVAKYCPEELQDERGRPKFNLQLFMMDAAGNHIGAALWPGKQIAVADEQGVRLEDCISFFPPEKSG